MSSNLNKTKRISITFIIPTLDAGGAERVMSFIAENLDREVFNVDLLVIGSKRTQAYKIKGIPVTFLNKERVTRSIFLIFRHLNKNKSKIVVSAIGHLNVIMALISIAFPKTVFVGRETIVRSGKKQYKESDESTFKSKLLSSLPPLLLDAIICQSKDMKTDLIQNYNYPKEKLYVLNNPITSSFSIKSKNFKSDVKQLVTVGRLEKQKGHSRLINLLSKISFPFHYTIIGSGSEKKSLLRQVRELHLEESITFVDYTSDVYTHLSKSDVFLSGSYVEGFPNAIIESCAVGTPVVAFQALGGLNEIIENGVNGFIAIDEQDFHQKLHQTILSEWNAKSISHSVKSKYSENIILSKYKEFFLHLLKVTK